MIESVRAFRPAVPLVHEVLHASFEQHAYPSHTHDEWTVLLIDSGAVVYGLERETHHAEPGTLTILPPHVPHDGRTAVAGSGFHKRVLYLDEQWMPTHTIGALALDPRVSDPRAVALARSIHHALRNPGDALAAECAVLELGDLVRVHGGSAIRPSRDAPLARRLRGMLDEHLAEPFTIAQAARELGAHPSHLVRAFSQAYGIAPHRYVVGRRIDRARRLLLDGHSPAMTAAEVGFHDQAHFTRHFRRVLGTTPAAFAA